MKIGIISDLHDNLRHLDVVRNELKEHSIEMLVFCGDFDMPFSMRGFVDFKVPIKAVLGNGDPDIQKFQYQLQNLPSLQNLKVELNFRFHDFIADNCRIAVTHGDDDQLISALVESQLYDLLCVGHSHQANIEKRNRTLVVNPGSLVGWLYEKKDHFAPVSYSVYNTKTKKAVIYRANI